MMNSKKNRKNLPVRPACPEVTGKTYLQSAKKLFMKLNPVLPLLVAFAVSLSVKSQSIYHLRYKYPGTNDTASYEAFLVRYDNGSGFVRVSYMSPVSNKNLLIEMDTEEQYATDNSGMENTNTLVLKMQNPRFIRGDSNTQYLTPVFLFRMDPATGYFEPQGVNLSDNNPGVTPGTGFTGRLLQQQDVTRSFALKFFNKGEDFFINFLKPKTRGGFSLEGEEKKIKLHLLIVADINNSSIGPSCRLDMKMALETFDSVSKYMGIPIIPKMISGKTFSKKNVETAIANLKPSPDDIVVFYYSGHGFRIPENPRRFPNLKLKNFPTERKNFKDSIAWLNKSRQDNITYSLNLEDIYDSLKAKGARFTLVLSDCCNDDIFGTNATGSRPGKSRGSNVDWSENNIRNLFLNKTPMSILATAAQSGQRATSKNSFGGFFSFYFKTAMENYSSKLKNNVSWDQIFQDAKKQTTFKANHTYCGEPSIPENICRQYPDYRIMPGK